jgi:hypothetical protein
VDVLDFKIVSDLGGWRGMREFGIKTPEGHRIMIGQTIVN